MRGNFHTRRRRAEKTETSSAVLSAARASIGLITATVCMFILAPAANAALIDLSAPDADVHDPVAALASVDTECHAGQVDLNTASAQALGDALHIASEPTVQRIIDARPWLKGADLSSIQGVSPDKAATIAAKTCATQPTLPPAHPLACTSSSQVDLQAASAEQIADMLRLPAVTAQDFVAARPLPQDLSQVITPRVRGLSFPKLKQLLDADAICVTPAPMLAGGTAWRWATAAGGAVVRRDGFALIVPVGRVTDPVGAYISVTPLPDPDDGGVPMMDATIHGEWASGDTTVAVQGPWIGVEEERPAVLHYSSDRGLALSLGDGTALSGPGDAQTVTAQLYSLSQVQFGTTTCQGSPPAPGGPAPLCLQDLIDGSAKQAWQDQLRRSGKQSNDALTPRSFCGSIVTAVSLPTSRGGLPWGMNCIPDVPDSAAGKVSWSNHNDTYNELTVGPVEIASAGIVYSTSLSGSGHTSSVGGKSEGDWFLRQIIDHAHLPGVLFPGQSLDITKTPSFLNTELDAYADPTSTGAWKSVETLVGAAAEIAGESWDRVARNLSTLQECLPLGWDKAVSCIKSNLENFLEETYQGLDGRTKLARKFRWAAAVFKALDGVDIVGSLSVSLGSAAFSNNTHATFTNQPKRPTADGKGRAILDQCLSHGDYSWTVDEACQDSVYGIPGRAGGAYIARDPFTHRSVFVAEDGTAKSIATGGVFNCLADTMFVFDVASQPALTAATHGDASCADAGPVKWDYKPLAEGGNIPNNVILRERPEDAGGGPIGTWLINNRSEIQTIQSGGIYLCLAYANPVIWNVPYGNVPWIVGVQWWRPIGTAPASCG